MTTSDAAPRTQNLTMYGGADFLGTEPFLAGPGDPGGIPVGDPIPIDTPTMQVRRLPWVGSDLILTATCTVVDSNEAQYAVAGSLVETAAVAFGLGHYDLFAIRADTGAEVALLTGTVVLIANVTPPPTPGDVTVTPNLNGSYAIGNATVTPDLDGSYTFSCAVTRQLNGSYALI